MVTKFQFISLDQRKQPHADFFWMQEGKASHNRPYIHCVLPKGICLLIYVYKGSFQLDHNDCVFQEGDLVIGGQLSKIGRFIVKEDFGLFALCLQPYAIPALLSLPGRDFMDQVMRSTAFKFDWLDVLQDKLRATSTNQERMQLMLQELSYMNKRLIKIDPRFSKLLNEMRNPDPRHMQKILAKSNVSQRQFQRTFKQLTGYTPKQFQRIARLQPILDKAYPSNLTQLALEFGYYDQSHFINDFKKITGGITPSQYYEGVDALKWKSLGESIAFFQS
ncbi:MAG: helix-turn-helix domain-containing protein [Bacteroidota bacterium]